MQYLDLRHDTVRDSNCTWLCDFRSSGQPSRCWYTDKLQVNDSLDTQQDPCKTVQSHRCQGEWLTMYRHYFLIRLTRTLQRAKTPPSWNSWETTPVTVRDDVCIRVTTNQIGFVSSTLPHPAKLAVRREAATEISCRRCPLPAPSCMFPNQRCYLTRHCSTKSSLWHPPEAVMLFSNANETFLGYFDLITNMFRDIPW